jgi:hypothetical protein
MINIVIDLFVCDKRQNPCCLSGKYKTKNTNRMIVGVIEELNLFQICVSS